MDTAAVSVVLSVTASVAFSDASSTYSRWTLRILILAFLQLAFFPSWWMDINRSTTTARAKVCRGFHQPRFHVTQPRNVVTAVKEAPCVEEVFC